MMNRNDINTVHFSWTDFLLTLKFIPSLVNLGGIVVKVLIVLLYSLG